MYRIYFDPNLGRFLIQVLSFGLFWRSVKTLIDSELSLLTFETFDEANKHIESIGLNKLYQDRSAHSYRSYMTAA